MASAGSRVLSPSRSESGSDSEDSESDSAEEDSDDEPEPVNKVGKASLSGQPAVTKGRRPLDDTLRIWSFA
jgi:hypothetical protein